MTTYISDIDSNRFGFKIAKLDFFGLSPEKVVEEIRNSGAKLIIARVACEQIGLINQLENLDFKTMDFQLTYKYDLKNYSESKGDLDTDILVREAKRGDIETLKTIAAESFYHYGHYFADDRLDKKKSSEIYIDWVGRSVESKEVADIVFIAEKGDEIAGFLSFKINTHKIYYYAAGVQGAVKEKYRNQNVFRILAKHGLLWGHKLNLCWEEHNVLLTNYPVNRSFIKIGFIPEKSFVTLHGWI